jgi:hypothetical protein
MADTPTSDDPCCAGLFDTAKDAMDCIGQAEGDLTSRMNALRDTAPAMKGSLSPDIAQFIDIFSKDGSPVPGIVPAEFKAIAKPVTILRSSLGT